MISSLILSSGFPIFRLSCLKHILTDLHAVLVQNTTLSFAQKAWVSFLKFIIPRPHVSGPCFELPVCMSEKSLCFWSIEYISSWYFAFLGVYGPNSTSALDPFLLPEREAKDHRICENNPKCVLYWHEGLGGGQGWMGLDGWRGWWGWWGWWGWGVYCKLWEIWWNMMEYDGVKQDGIWWCETRVFAPWMNLLFAGSDSCDAGLKEVDCKFMEGKNCTARASAMLTWVNRRVALDCWGALEMFNSEDTQPKGPCMFTCKRCESHHGTSLPESQSHRSTPLTCFWRRNLRQERHRGVNGNSGLLCGCPKTSCAFGAWTDRPTYGIWTLWSKMT